MKYRTIENEMLDDICFNYYGREDAVTDVLEANPALAEYAASLPAGLIIELPDLPEKESTQTISLWD